MPCVDTVSMVVRGSELGSMRAAARDQRTSPAVGSARITDREKHPGVRLFRRTTRSLQPTENGRIFYDFARHIRDAIDDAESAVMDVTRNPRGTIFIAAPLGIAPPLHRPAASSPRMCRCSKTSIRRSTSVCASAAARLMWSPKASTPPAT